MTVEDGVIAALGAGNDKGLPRVDGEGKRLLTWPPAASWYSRNRSIRASFISRLSGIAPLYSTERQGPSRWMPMSWAPPLPFSMTSRAARMAFKVCSLVSVSTEHCHPVTPCAGGHVTYLTLSPEVPGAVEIVPALGELGITVAMGHSAAGYDTSWAAVKAGGRPGPPDDVPQGAVQGQRRTRPDPAF